MVLVSRQGGYIPLAQLARVLAMNPKVVGAIPGPGPPPLLSTLSYQLCELMPSAGESQNWKKDCLRAGIELMTLGSRDKCCNLLHQTGIPPWPGDMTSLYMYITGISHNSHFPYSQYMYRTTRDPL